MKQVLIILLLLTGVAVSAQHPSNSLGLRFSGSDEIQSVGVEVSYQHALAEARRLEADLGISNSAFADLFRLAGFYHWIWPLESGFYWYAGPGGGIGLLDYDVPIIDQPESDVFLILGGQVGIEYIFESIPLQLSLDLRPEFFIGSLDDDLDVDLGFSVRYIFKK